MNGNLLCKQLQLHKKKCFEPIYKTGTDSQTQRASLWLPGGSGEGERWTESLGLVDANWYIQNE